MDDRIGGPIISITIILILTTSYEPKGETTEQPQKLGNNPAPRLRGQLRGPIPRLPVDPEPGPSDPAPRIAQRRRLKKHHNKRGKLLRELTGDEL